MSLDVGPRILDYRTSSGVNVLKNFEEQLGQSGEDSFVIRGGHRVWVAPEDSLITYHWDNQPVTYDRAEDGEVVISSVQDEPIHIQKDLGIRLAESGTRTVIRHRVTNLGGEPLRLATWGLTVMPEGGMAIIPQPPLGSHPEDLLPNRGIILWPYTDLSDPRWRLGTKFWLLAQADMLPTKMGIAHRERWVAYLNGDTLFVKTFAYVEGEEYPDGGCNFEAFTNPEMLEIESLGPMRTLAPNDSAEHFETWHVFSGFDPVEITSEDQLADWLQPFLSEALAD